MGNMLRRVHHSGFMRRIYQRIPLIKGMVDKIYGIYKGHGNLMTNRIYWQIYSVIKYLRLDCRLLKKRHMRHMSLPIDDMGAIYINPDRIEFAVMPSNHKHEKIDPIEDGSWDLRKERFKNTDTFIALQEHFTKGIPLPDTKYCTHLLEQIEDRETRGEFDIKCQEIDELYGSIRDRGYKTQKELGNSKLADEIQVAVGRNGIFLLEGGELRLTIAKLLGLKSIPVIITRRHYQWAKFRKEVFSHSQDQPKGAYQPLIHPDLQKIPYDRKTEDRWNLIVNNLPFHGGTVLDIGSNWGYFCHRFEDLGFDCYAVECNYRWLYFLKKLREAENKKFEIIPRSVFDIERKTYDIVLALSIFHHFLRSKTLYDKLTKLLGDLDMKVMFFEPHQTGCGFKDAYIDYSEIEFIHYILENSCLNRYALLGRTDVGRNLYLLTSL